MPNKIHNDVSQVPLPTHFDAMLELIEEEANANSFSTQMRPHIPVFSIMAFYGIAVFLMSGYAGLIQFFAILSIVLTLLGLNDSRERRRLKLIINVLSELQRRKNEDTRNA